MPRRENPHPERPASAGARLLEWYRGVLLAPLRLLVGVVRTYAANRERVQRLTAGERVARLLKFLCVATLGAWLAIWLLADDEDRERLTRAVKAYLAGEVEHSRPGHD